MTKNLMSLIRPKVLVAIDQSNLEITEDYLMKLQSELGFIHLNVEQIFENEVQR